MKKDSRMKKSVIALSSVAAILAAVYTGGWFYASSKGEDVLKNALENASNAYNITYDSVQKSGFPFSLGYTLQNLEICAISSNQCDTHKEFATYYGIFNNTLTLDTANISTSIQTADGTQRVIGHQTGSQQFYINLSAEGRNALLDGSIFQSTMDAFASKNIASIASYVDAAGGMLTNYSMTDANNATIIGNANAKLHINVTSDMPEHKTFSVDTTLNVDTYDKNAFITNAMALGANMQEQIPFIQAGIGLASSPGASSFKAKGSLTMPVRTTNTAATTLQDFLFHLKLNEYAAKNMYGEAKGSADIRFKNENTILTSRIITDLYSKWNDAYAKDMKQLELQLSTMPIAEGASEQQIATIQKVRAYAPAFIFPYTQAGEFHIQTDITFNAPIISAITPGVGNAKIVFNSFSITSDDFSLKLDGTLNSIPSPDVPSKVTLTCEQCDTLIEQLLHYVERWQPAIELSTGEPFNAPVNELMIEEVKAFIANISLAEASAPSTRVITFEMQDKGLFKISGKSSAEVHMLFFRHLSNYLGISGNFPEVVEGDPTSPTPADTPQHPIQ